MKKANPLDVRPGARSYLFAPAAALLFFFLATGAASAQAQTQPTVGMPQATVPAPPQANFHVEYRGGRLSVRAQDASLRKVLAEVARQSGIQIIGMENVRGRVSVEFSDQPLGPALTSLLIEVDYAISGDLARPEGIAHARLMVMERHAVPAGAGSAPAATTAVAAPPDDSTADADADANADPDAPDPDPDADANADPDADANADANTDADPNAAENPPAQPPAGPPVYINQPGQVAQPGQINNQGPPQRILPPGRFPPGGAPGGPTGSMSFNPGTADLRSLTAGIQSANPAIQAPAFLNLAAVDSGAAVRAAVAAAKSPDATVRLGALTLLDSSPAAPEVTVLQTLGEALADKDVQVKEYALDALVRRGKAGASYLTPALKDSDPALRLRVVQDLAGKDWATPLLLMALNDSDPSVRFAAASLIKPAPPRAQ